MRHVFAWLLAAALSFSAAAQTVTVSPAASPQRVLAPTTVSMLQVSASEFRVRVPVKNAPSLSTVVEYRFSKHATTNVWSITDATVKDLLGVATDVALSFANSVWEGAHGIGYTADAYQAGVTYDFFGAGHGNEARTGFTARVDRRDVGLAYAVGREIVISQTMDVLKPVGTDAGTTIGTATMRHTIDASGVRVDRTVTITTPGLSYRTAYGAMMPTNNVSFNRSQAGTGPPVEILTNNTVTETGKTASFYQVFNTDTGVNPYRLRVTLAYGTPEKDTPWSAVTAPEGWFFSRADHGKWYLNFVGDTVTAVTPGLTTVHAQLYDVIYEP